MPNICILTDSTAQFSRRTFSGQNRVKVVPLAEAGDAKAGQASFLARYEQLGRLYDTILVLGISGALHPFCEVASLAAMQFGGTTRVQVLDSQNAGPGLGLLVELAADLAADERPVDEIEQAIRGVIPHIYSVISFLSLLPLAQAGLVSYSPADPPETLVHSIFMLEEGRLTPMLKVHTARHVIESLREFTEEFTPPRHVAIARGTQCALRTRPLKEFVSEAFPGTPYLEQPLSPALAGLFGDEALALVILEGPN